MLDMDLLITYVLQKSRGVVSMKKISRSTYYSMRGIICALSTLSVMGTVEGATLTAVCNEPTGYAYRYSEKNGTHPTGGEDGFKGATWSFSWDERDGNNGKVTHQSSRFSNNKPSSEQATVVPSTEGHYVSFIINYPNSVWVYTIYPKSEILMASRHTSGYLGVPTGGAIFHARCQVGIS